MATVYLARDLQLDRNVALKMLHSQFASDPTFAERLRREARSAAGLSHPNIVGVYDWGRRGERYFIVMEYVSGHSLAEIITARGALGSKAAATIAFEVAAALACANRAGIVHRDIKPQNLLLSNDGHVKVTDFGIAAMMGRDRSVGLAEAGTVVGTSTYLSPEQARGEPTDARSDLYSLGVVLYEMLSGYPPFRGDTPMAVAYQHVQTPPVPLREIAQGVPRALESLTMRLLAKDPEDRYQSADDLCEHLQIVRQRLDRLAPEAPAEPPRPAPAPPAPAQTRQTRQEDRQPETATPPVRQQPQPTPQPRQRPAGEPVRRAPSKGAAARRPPGYGERSRSYRSGSRDNYRRLERQRRSGLFFVGFAVLLVVLLILIVVLVNVLGSDDNTGPAAPATIDVPSVYQLEEAVAVRTLESAGFSVVTVREANAEVPAGRVFNQQPRAGTKLAPGGSAITLTISAGASAVPVPNVLSWQAIDAERTLRAAGFTVTLVQVGSDRPAGEVLDQEPAPLVAHAAGAAVTLNVSTGPVAILVPNVVGMNDVAAAVAITNARLVVVSQTEASDIVAQGLVIRTEPAVGSQIAEGNQVIIYVSTGPDVLVMPDLTGLSPTTAFIQLDTLGVTADVVAVAPMPGEATGLIVAQSPTAGTQITPSSILTLYVTGEVDPTSGEELVPRAGVPNQGAETTDDGLIPPALTPQPAP